MPAPFDSDDVRAAYDGLEAQLYELMMGELLHIGGLESSLDLAERAGISKGVAQGDARKSRGVDLCCGNGASMRMLVSLLDVGSMTGVELSGVQVGRARSRTESAGLDDRIRIVQADARATGLPDAESDFVWAEDAWCYVPDKRGLVAEAIRLVRPGGAIAFTDWTLGDEPLEGSERERFYEIMKFKNLWSAGAYCDALVSGGCEIVESGDTGRFARCMELYRDMFDLQLGWDVMKLAGTNRAILDVLSAQLGFIRDLARAGKVCQTRVIARRCS